MSVQNTPDGQNKKLLSCKSCESTTFNVFEVEFKDSTKHVQPACATCFKPLRYVPQYEKKDMDIGDRTLLFGKHKGKKLKEIPQDYLQWGAENFEGKIQSMIRSYLDQS